MSSNNNPNDHSGIAIAVALAGTGLLIFFALIYALFLFAAFVLSVVALCAWNKPLMLGKATLEPEEARAFVKRGLMGAFLLPAFVVFCEVVFGIRVNPDYLPHIVLGGYALGSVGLAMLEDSNETEMGQTIEHIPAPPSVPHIQPPPKGFIPPGYGPPPSDGPSPFRFASWDDEEERP